MTALPNISILVAARNEAPNIVRCLEALAEQDYPQQKMQVLLGDDSSEDQTAALAERVIEKYPFMQLVHINDELPGLRGKANVLAQLAKRAKGKYLLFTDADVAVNPFWARNMATEAQKRSCQMLTGCTVVQGEGLLVRLQALDWLYAQTMIAGVSACGLPVTAMGNNMLVSQKAYRAVGGYEGIPFSVTEDYELFREITGNGGRFAHLLNRKVLAATLACSNISVLFQQRKRWMQGAIQLPWYMLAILGLQASFFPLMIAALFFIPVLSLMAWAVKAVVQALLIGIQLKRLGQWKLWPYLWLYEPYLLCISTATAVIYLWPSKVKWKGREYA